MSRSSPSPATVVMHFRPFRCCTRMCTWLRWGGWWVDSVSKCVIPPPTNRRRGSRSTRFPRNDLSTASDRTVAATPSHPSSPFHITYIP